MTPRRAVGVRDDVFGVEKRLAEELGGAVGELEVVVGDDLLCHGSGVHHDARGAAHAEVSQAAVLEGEFAEGFVREGAQAEEVAHDRPGEGTGRQSAPRVQKKLRNKEKQQQRRDERHAVGGETNGGESAELEKRRNQWRAHLC